MTMRRFCYLLCCLLALASLAVCRPAFANDIETTRVNDMDMRPYTRYYRIKVEVERTVDAGGWDAAYIYIRGTDSYGKEEEASGFNYSTLNPDDIGYPWRVSENLASKFSDWKTTVYEEDAGFPYEVVIYTDFGGGMTWRSWEADVTVYIDDINIASKHITASSAAFSSSNTYNSIKIDPSRYPYLEKMNVIAPETVETEGESASATIKLGGFNQYGHAWWDPGKEDGTLKQYDMLRLEDSAGNVWVREHEGYTTEVLTFNVSHKGPKDERVTYTVTAKTPNSVNTESIATFDIDYHYKHRVEIIKDGEVVSTHVGSKDEELSLDFPELVEPGYAVGWELEGGGILVPRSEEGPKYIFGDSDGKLTATAKPYSYVVAFDGNGATGGKMGSRVFNVGKSYYLPPNMFAQTGHLFVGWSTEPDGSGDFYQNKDVVKNLSLENDATVTLYAQWKVKTFKVTFVNKFTGERMTQEVDYGEAATPPELPQAYQIDDARHSTFVKWNKKFSEVKSNMTVTSVQKTEPHTFEENGGVKVCHVCGAEVGGASQEGSVFGDGSAQAIAVGSLIVLLGGAGAYVYAKKRKGGDA